MQSKKVVKAKVEEVTRLGPVTKNGEDVFAAAHLFASFNDTFVVRNLTLFFLYFKLKFEIHLF